MESAIGGQSLLEYIPRISPVMPGGVRGRAPSHLAAIAHQIALCEYTPNRVCISVPPRHGKMIADSYPVLTPDGWRTHGELIPGSMVYAVDGTPTRVTGRSGGGTCDLELVTSDGAVIVTHGDHLWGVSDRTVGKGLTRVMSTDELLAAGLYAGEGDRTFWRFQISYPGALQGTTKDLPHEPYHLGLWLADASLDRPGPRGSAGPRYAGARRIPEAYLTASVDQRRELLRGLVGDERFIMVDGRRQVRVTTTNKDLVEDVAVPVSAIRGHRRAYAVQWATYEDVHTKGRRRLVRDIVAIRPARYPELGHCIAVTHPSHLYLVGRELVPTHNTELLLHGIGWWLSRHPEHTVAYTSYSADIAGGKSLRARDIAQASGTLLRTDANRASEWRTTSDGGVLATGVGGPLTGQGANLLIVDDPIKNREEAESPTHRQRVYEWFTSTAMTRLTPGGAAIVVHTRWHQDDLIGRLRKTGKWTCINLPAVNPDGSYLWPEGGWDAATMEARRGEVGEYDWWSLFMGDPRPRGGRLFEEPTWYEKPTVMGTKFLIACDPAATAKTHADYSVIIVGSVWLNEARQPCIDVLDVIRAQVEIPRLVDMLAQEQQKWRAPVVVESVGGFKAVPQMLRSMLRGVRIVEIQPTQDKFTRALPVAAAWNAGRIRLPGSRTGAILGQGSRAWLPTFLDELSAFVGVGDAHDDQVDALAHLYTAAAQFLAPRAGMTGAEAARYMPFGG